MSLLMQSSDMKENTLQLHMFSSKFGYHGWWEVGWDQGKLHNGLKNSKFV